MLKAVCAIIKTDSKFVAVSRKKDHKALGLPGGKIENGEDAVVALIRELSEELDVSPTFFKAEDFELVFEAVCKGDVDYYTYTYMYIGNAYKAIMEFENGEGALVKPMTLEDLCLKKHSPFHVYNKQLVQALK